ncbi:ATP-binding protein [Streptomyces sp. Je 1-79]|uniref:ATP-binding protein n=1 Tax=Streptomyces sp. Je 1-79 TaxID=2943847 RepID=UPI0021A85A4D|nr:ATP-binding protein [Streptomyces sp. Je 1-79]MCT4356069.1 ATP-binding protein [Streptomyces sp. Je 1-79]
MALGNDGGSKLRCVLPFEAVPGELKSLRRVIRSTLGQWGAMDAADEIELIATELATNVIKHVGEGAPATLVLEPRGSRLRVELHDGSPVLPRGGRQADCDEECGRGLHLLASMSADWGALPTRSGKVVWCELSLVADAVCARAQRAFTALDGYRDLLGVRVSGSAPGSRVNQEAATTLIADLLVWLALHGSDPDEVLIRAQQLYEAGEAA